MAVSPYPGWLRVEEIAHALDLLDGAELRADQDLLEAQFFDALDAPARLLRRADEIDRGDLRQLCRLGAHGVCGAGLAADRHSGFEIVPAAEPAGRGPALGFFGGVGDPPWAAPGADQDRRPPPSSRPGRPSGAGGPRP